MPEEKVTKYQKLERSRKQAIFDNDFDINSDKSFFNKKFLTKVRFLGQIFRFWFSLIEIIYHEYWLILPRSKYLLLCVLFISISTLNFVLDLLICIDEWSVQIYISLMTYLLIVIQLKSNFMRKIKITLKYLEFYFCFVSLLLIRSIFSLITFLKSYL